MSWEWLNDPEIRDLTMTPVFTREDQLRFFEQLPRRTDYLIWSVVLDGTEVIGAAGLKNHRGDTAEYWGYIGKKQYWNNGLGKLIVIEVEKKAIELGFFWLDLKVSTDNPRAISLYQNTGFVIDPYMSSSYCLRMIKYCT